MHKKANISDTEKQFSIWWTNSKSVWGGGAFLCRYTAWKWANKWQSAKKLKIAPFHATCGEGGHQVDELRSHGEEKRKKWEKAKLEIAAAARSLALVEISQRSWALHFAIASLPRFLDKVIFDSFECIIVSIFWRCAGSQPAHGVNVKISWRILCIKYVFINLNLQQSWRSWQIL